MVTVKNEVASVVDTTELQEMRCCWKRPFDAPETHRIRG